MAEPLLVSRTAIGDRRFSMLADGVQQVKITQASYDATVANYRQTVLTSFQEVEDNLAELRILGQETDIVDGAVKFAQQSLEISTDQYRGACPITCR